MALHMLRVVLGDEAFWAGCGYITAGFQNSHVTTDDFSPCDEDACLNTATNARWTVHDLAWFFHESESRRILKVTAAGITIPRQSTLAVSIPDSYSRGLYRMPIEIGITVPAPATPPPGAAAAALNRADQRGQLT